MFESNKGLLNKDKDITEQRYSFTAAPGLVGVSLLTHLAVIGSSQTLVAVNTAAFGLSGTPILGLQLQRFIAGTGLTTIALNGSSLLTIGAAFGTSGNFAHAVPATNTSLLQNGDVLQIVTSGANTAATYCHTVVLQQLQATRTDFGV